jgi:hypothetical protein
MNSRLRKYAALGGTVLLIALLLGACEMMGNPGNPPEGSQETKQGGRYALHIGKEGLSEYVFPAVYPGYGEVAGFEAPVSNTGIDTAENIAISLSGIGAEAFELSPAVIERLEAGAAASVTVTPKTGLGGGDYQATVSVTGPNGTAAAFKVKFIVSTTALYGIRLDIDGEAHTFPTRGLNSPATAPLTVSITNIGNEGTGTLSVGLGGENPGSFQVSPATVPNIGSGETGTFTVQPKAELGTGSYTASVRVSGGNELSASFGVSIRVVEQYIEIATAEDLARIGSPDFPADAEYKLVRDLSLDQWKPVTSTPEAAFTGTFDGNGHGIRINSYAEEVLNTGPVKGYIGVFGYILGGTVENLIVDLKMPDEQQISAGPTGNAKIQYIGGVSGYGEKAIYDHITVQGDLNLSKSDGESIYIGGITGYLKGGSISGSESRANLKGREPYHAASGGSYTGGLVGRAETVTISGSRVSGRISAYSDRGSANAGGAAGETIDSRISSIAVSAEVEASVSEYFGGMTTFGNSCYAGGIVGFIGGPEGSQVIQSFSTGPVSAISYAPLVGGNPLYAGGIVGMTGVRGNTLISDCYSRGDITAKTGDKFDGESANINAGGIAGQLSLVTLQNSYVTGVVTAQSNRPQGNFVHAGGIAAVLYGLPDGTITIKSCAALSPRISWSQFTLDDMILNRIAIPGTKSGLAEIREGTIGQPRYPENTFFISNIANKDMDIDYQPSDAQAKKVPKIIINPGPNTEDGANVPFRPEQKIYADLGWDFNTVWTMGSDGYPALRNIPLN